MTGQDLRAIREACGVPELELSDALGWTTSRIYDHERGGRVVMEPHAIEYLTMLAELVRVRAARPKESA